MAPDLARPDTATQFDGSKPDRYGSLDLLFKPRSVAIVGASNNPGSLSGLTLNYLIRSQFAGEIWPVNPNRTSVQGVPAYASIADLPGAPDVAIIVVPLAIVQNAVEACAAKGVGAVMVFTTGYGETGEEGQLAQQKLLDTARAGDMRLLGPNCLGCWNAETGFYGTFAIGLNNGFARAGNVAVVSQSGAYGDQIAHLARKRGLGVRYFVSTGNEADINVGEAIAWMADQPDVDVIIAYAEGTHDPQRLEAALAYAQAMDKQVIFMKVGRSVVGAAAANSHTATLAGDDSIWDAVFAKYGVYRAMTSDEQIDVAYAAARRIFPEDNTLGILTVSGGFGIQLCDAGALHGLEIPPLPVPVAERLEALLPFGSINNPLDVSGQVTSNLASLLLTGYAVGSLLAAGLAIAANDRADHAGAKSQTGLRHQCAIRLEDIGAVIGRARNDTVAHADAALGKGTGLGDRNQAIDVDAVVLDPVGRVPGEINPRRREPFAHAGLALEASVNGTGIQVSTGAYGHTAQFDIAWDGVTFTALAGLPDAPKR